MEILLHASHPTRFYLIFCKSDPSRLRSGLANKNKVSKDFFGCTLFSMNFLSVNLYVKLTYKSVPHKAFFQVATITRGRLKIMMSFNHYNDRLIFNIRIPLHRKSLSHTETGPRFREKFLYIRFPLRGELPYMIDKMRNLLGTSISRKLCQSIFSLQLMKSTSFNIMDISNTRAVYEHSVAPWRLRWVKASCCLPHRNRTQIEWLQSVTSQNVGL